MWQNYTKTQRHAWHLKAWHLKPWGLGSALNPGSLMFVTANWFENAGTERVFSGEEYGELSIKEL